MQLSLVRKRTSNFEGPLVSPFVRITGKANLNHKCLAHFLQLEPKEFLESAYGNRHTHVAPLWKNYAQNYKEI